MNVFFKNKLTFVAAICFGIAVWMFYKFLVPTEVFFNKNAILFAIWAFLTVVYTACAITSMIRKEPLRAFSIVFLFFDVILVAAILAVLDFSLAMSGL